MKILKQFTIVSADLREDQNYVLISANMEDEHICFEVQTASAKDFPVGSNLFIELEATESADATY